jgi:zinc D-Ala-D-Ala carboxypeptidase
MPQITLILCSFLFIFTLTGCAEQNPVKENQQKIQTSVETKPNNKSSTSETKGNSENQTSKPVQQKHTTSPTQTQTKPNTPSQKNTVPKAKDDAIQVVAHPESIPVLVNKTNKLPDNYKPNDLVYTTIPFIFSGKSDKRKMRKEASSAISNLFAGAKKQGINLLGVSAYRSHITQTALFNAYVKKDGYAKARTYSALPGTSEHETGLSIDVTGGNGKCAAQDCFGNTSEAKWLQNHAGEYGFIIRYPKGKEVITGYKYEPWHLRYVGKSISTEIMNNNSTLEEYYNTVQVSN